VDFVIGHATPVGDQDAVAFARELYGYLGVGESLKLGFDAAKIVSNPYRMAGRKNAADFELILPTISMDPDELNVAQCNELIRFLQGDCLTSVERQFSEHMGMKLMADLARLREENLDDPEFSFLRRWHREKLMRLSGIQLHKLFLSKILPVTATSLAQTPKATEGCPQKVETTRMF